MPARARRGRRAFETRLALTATLVVLGSVCLSASGGAGAPSDALDALVVQSFPEPVPAPDVTLKNLDGRPFTLREYRGRVVFLNFWATWCVPCRQEMPAMERLYQDYRERGLTVVAVNFKEAAPEVRRFMQELRLSFPPMLDIDGTVSKTLGVRGLPVTFLLDRDGRILWKAIGSREWDGPHGRAYLDQVLRGSGS